MSDPQNSHSLLDMASESVWHVVQWAVGAIMAAGVFVGTRLWRFGSLMGEIGTKLDGVERTLNVTRAENNQAHADIGAKLEKHGEQIAENRTRVDAMKETVSQLSPRLPWLHGQRKGDKEE